MHRSTFPSLVFLLILLNGSAVVTPIKAATVAFDHGFAMAMGGIDFVEIPRFDPGLGSLTSIELFLVGDGELSGTALNADPFSIEFVSVHGSIGIDVIGFLAATFVGSEDVSFPISVLPLPDPPFGPLSDFDFPLIGGGGILLTDVGSIEDFTATIPGEHYAFDLGAGPAEIDTPVEFVDGFVSGVFSVTYTYTVVPEPTTFGTCMVVSGLASLVGIAGRRKRPTVSTRSSSNLSG